MIHEEKCQPIKAQNLGSHGSKGPHAKANRLTRSSSTRENDKGTHGRPLEQRGASGADRCQFKLAQGWPGLLDSRFKKKDNFAANSG